MLSKEYFIRRVKNLRARTDQILFTIPSRHTWEEVQEYLRIIRHFGFKNIKIEMTIHELRFSTQLRKIGMNDFILRLDRQILSFLPEVKLDFFLIWRENYSCIFNLRMKRILMF